MTAVSAASGWAFNWSALACKALQLRLRQPLRTAAGSFSKREVLLLKVTVDCDGQRICGYGEASALPGWSTDSFADNQSLAQQISSALRQQTVAINLQPQQQFDLPGWQLAGMEACFPALQQQPVLRFGLELALLDALARYRQWSLARLLSALIAAPSAQLPVARAAAEPAVSIAVQYTLGAADYADSNARLAAAVQQGFTHAKLKVGVATLAADLSRVQRLIADFPQLSLRLDANAAWDTQQTLSVCAALRSSRVELIEQPVAEHEFVGLLQQYDQCGPLLAADESSVPAARCAHWMQQGMLHALVLKPAVHGGLLPALTLLQLASRHQVKVVLSTLLEAAVARSAIAHLAAACPEQAGPHGLATGAWFTEDVVAAPDQVRSGRLHLRTGAGIGLQPDAFFA